MIIKIGATSDDKRVLHKSWSGKDIAVQLKHPCDILNPIFILGYDSSFVSANYLHCSELNRYYFIDNINLMPGHRMELVCSVDVLMSYAPQISALTCLISRQEQTGLGMVPDANVVTQNYNPIDIYNFSKSFDIIIGTYVLNLLGGM